MMGRKKVEQRLIDANKLEANMYHEAFETDTDMQKWDSGCWIRYKMFENQIEKLPTIEAIPIEWIKKRMEHWAEYGDQYITITEMLEDWEKEDETDRR